MKNIFLFIPERSSIPSQIAIRTIAPPRSGCLITKKIITTVKTIEAKSWTISPKINFLLEIKLAKKTISAILANSTGWTLKIPKFSPPEVPWIVIRGRKGGSTLVVAALHALLALAEARQKQAVAA